MLGNKPDALRESQDDRRDRIRTTPVPGPAFTAAMEGFAQACAGIEMPSDQNVSGRIRAILHHFESAMEESAVAGQMVTVGEITNRLAGIMDGVNAASTTRTEEVAVQRAANGFGKALCTAMSIDPKDLPINRSMGEIKLG